MDWKIPLFKIYWDDEDILQVTRAIEKGMNWADGPNIKKFEELVAGYVGSEYCLTFSSGTTALHAVLHAFGIGKGDEVIVPSFTFISTANAPLFVGAKPVFADIEDATYGLSPEDVAEKITRKTRAIIPVHYGGCPCRIKEITEIADDKGIPVIEDAAEAFGARIGARHVGTFGAAGMFSFCQNKIITTGEGGAVVTDSKKLYDTLKLIRSHGRSESGNYFSSSENSEYISLGYNFRISDITAALGIAQVKKADKIIRMRRILAGLYTAKMKRAGIPVNVQKISSSYFNVYQLFSVRLKKRNALMKHMGENGIMTKIYFSPVHRTKYYRNTMKYTCDLPVTTKISREILSLPIYPGMESSQIDYIVEAMKRFYEDDVCVTH